MVAPLKIEHLRLKAFRGATQDVLIPFDPSKRATLIFGENGTGKSTIVDSLTYLCEGSFGSLADRADAKKFEYLTSISSLSTDVLVELKVDGKVITAKQPKLNAPHLNTVGKPAISVLRRATLSEFVEAIPSKRFEKLKPFLATSNIEACEATLRKESTEISQQSFRFQRDFVAKQEALKMLWESEGDKTISAKLWADQVGNLDVASEQVYCDAVDSLENSQSAAQQQQVCVADAYLDQEKALDKAKAANALLESAKKSSSNAAESLLTVLMSTAHHLQKHGGDSCPVCERSIDVGTLQVNLSSRIAAMDQMDAAVTTVTQAATETSRVTAILEKQRAIWVNQLQNLSIELKGQSATLGDSTNALAALKELVDPKLDVCAQLQRAAAFNAEMVVWFKPLTAASEEKRKRINLKNAALQALEATNEAGQKMADSAALEKSFQSTLLIVEEQRKVFIRNALNQVSGDIDALYAKLHPGEPLNTIKLALKEGMQGSLDITANFETKVNVPPQAYYSEAHLDTLGICIFIAFAKKYAAPSTLVVLDDVLTSVDSVHLDRFIDFIDEQADSFGHVVMTTHYRPWRERFRFHQAASGHLHFIELKEWALSRGVLHDQTKTTLGELKASLNPQTFDRQIAASRAGIFLERVFDFLTIKYQAKMPRKTAGDYTLGEFMGAFQAKHLKQMEVEKIDPVTGVSAPRIALEPLFIAMEQFAWIRNQVGCHFNAGAAGASDADVRKFAEAVVALGDALVCPTGNDFPERDSGSFWQTKAKHCRMYPHKMI